MEKLMSETDYLNAMLNGAGTATLDQQAILEHPRKGARSTLVRIKGEAGTGKTFCLLAKLLGEAGRYPRDPRERWARQPVLFVCFNREMANYARHLIHPFPQAPLIHVTTFDSLVVGLMLKHLEKNPRPGTSDGPAPSVDYSFELVRAAMQEVAQRHPEERSKYYLDAANKRNVRWVADELSWLEASYGSETDAEVMYLSAAREGRGTNRRPGKAARSIILEIWLEHHRLLANANRFTVEQAVNELMGTAGLPCYNVIAIDEAQDLSVRSIQLLLKLRRDSQSRVYLSADEGQKIYQRDFLWKSLDADATGTTYTLRDNKRNCAAVRDFAERLRSGRGASLPLFDTSTVHLLHGDEEELVGLAADLAAREDQTTMLVGGPEWDAKLRAAGVAVRNPLLQEDELRRRFGGAGRSGQGAAAADSGRARKEVDVTQPGLYVMSELKAKGLEFDNVIVPTLHPFADDDDSERRLRYVHFSRARRELYVFLDDTTPGWLQATYPDLL